MKSSLLLLSLASHILASPAPAFKREGARLNTTISFSSTNAPSVGALSPSGGSSSSRSRPLIRSTSSDTLSTGWTTPPSTGSAVPSSRSSLPPTPQGSPTSSPSTSAENKSTGSTAQIEPSTTPTQSGPGATSSLPATKSLPSLSVTPFPSSAPPQAIPSEAADLGTLFGFLYANRDKLDRPEDTRVYIENVEKIKEQTERLFNSLETKPAPDPRCSHLTTKRSLIADLSDMAGDIPKLLSCAVEVINNLSDDVKEPRPNLQNIENETKILSEIQEYIDESNSKDDQSTTESSSTSTSCSSTVVPECTETISLSTSFISGSQTVSTITSTACSSVTACEASATTSTTTASNTPSATPWLCSPYGSTTKREYSELDERTLPDPNNFDIPLEYYEDVAGRPDSIEVVHRHTGTLSSARTKAFEADPFAIFVGGLTGCTSVGIVTEKGAWLSHFWEVPSMTQDEETSAQGTFNQERFQREVLDAIANGDGVQMPSPFPLGQSGGYLSPENNAQIFIMTPTKDGQAPLYGSQIAQIENLLTGDGAPWQGVAITRHLYHKPGKTEREKDRFELSERGKFFIEYDNNQEFDIDEEDWDAEPRKEPTAIWRLYMELERHYHEWSPKADQGCSAGNQRRDGSCARPTGTITSPGGTAETSAQQPTSTSIIGPGIGSTSTGDATTSSTLKFTTSSGVLIPTSSTDVEKTSSTLKSTTSSGLLIPTATTDVGKTSSTLKLTTSSGVLIPTATTAPSQSPSATITAYFQYDSNSGQEYCQVEGQDGSYQLKPSTTNDPHYKPCDWTTMPPPLITPAVTAYTTYINGEVGMCTDARAGKYAANTVATCQGSVSIVSTNMPMASAWSSSTAAAAAEASAAAAMTGDCTIIFGDFIFGQSLDSIFYLSNLGSWANEDTLLHEEDGCGLLSGWVWEETSDGKYQAGFELGGFDAGCVERAIKSAGGPDLQCNNKPESGELLTDDEVDMKMKVIDANNPW